MQFFGISVFAVEKVILSHLCKFKVFFKDICASFVCLKMKSVKY